MRWWRLASSTLDGPDTLTVIWSLAAIVAVALNAEESSDTWLDSVGGDCAEGHREPLRRLRKQVIVDSYGYRRRGSCRRVRREGHRASRWRVVAGRRSSRRRAPRHRHAGVPRPADSVTVKNALDALCGRRGASLMLSSAESRSLGVAVPLSSSVSVMSADLTVKSSAVPLTVIVSLPSTTLSSVGVMVSVVCAAGLASGDGYACQRCVNRVVGGGRGPSQGDVDGGGRRERAANRPGSRSRSRRSCSVVLANGGGIDCERDAARRPVIVGDRRGDRRRAQTD